MGTMFDAYTAWQISLYSANASMAGKLRALAETSTQRVESSITGASSLLKGLVMFAVATLLVLTYVSYMSVTSNASGMEGFR